MTKKEIKEKLKTLKCQMTITPNGYNFYPNSDDTISLCNCTVNCYYLENFKQTVFFYDEIKDIEIFNTHIVFLLQSGKNITVERF